MKTVLISPNSAAGISKIPHESYKLWLDYSCTQSYDTLLTLSRATMAVLNDANGMPKPATDAPGHNDQDPP